MRIPKSEFVFEDVPARPLLPKGTTLSQSNGADIYSANWNVSAQPEQAAAYLKTEMDMLSDSVDASGGLVGHIKAAVSRVEGQWVLSTAGTKCTRNAMCRVSTQVELAVIVFRTPQELIADWLRKTQTRLNNNLPPQK